MAGQSITFDFLTTGADKTASGFRKVADNTVLAAKGAKVLANVVETLGDKENRTAAESVLLAKALRQTGDAEDRVAARAVLADAAIRRLDDAMQDSTKSSGELRKALGGLKLNPGLLGPALLLAPAMTTLAGVAGGAAVSLGGAFAAAGGALAAFGAVAKPVLTDAKKAAEAVGKAQDAYSTAIANGVPKAKAFKAEQVAISKAYAGMTPQQIALSRQLGDMADAWDKVKAAQTPVIAGALQPWLKSVTTLAKDLGPVIAKVAPVLASLGAQFDALVSSGAFVKFRDFIANTGSKAVGAGGNVVIALIQAFITLLPKFQPLIDKAITGLAGLAPAIEKWAGSKKTAGQITAFMQWFHDNGPAVGRLLTNLGGALKALAPGLTEGGALELKVVSDFLGFVAKLPPGLAKPLAEVAGAMLILQKTGVVSVGIKFTGLAAGAAGAGSAAGPLAAAGAGIAAGIVLKVREDLQSGFKGIIKDIPTWFSFGSLGSLVISAQGWADLIVSKVRHSLLSWEDDVRHHIANTFDGIRHDVAARWDGLMSHIATMMDIAKERIRVTWDQIKLLFLRGVDFIMRTMGKLPGPLGAPFRAAHASIKASMDQIQRDVGAATRNIQADFDRLHGKTVQIHMNGQGLYTITGSVIAASQGKGGSGNAAGGLAAGGFITGGTPGRDSVLIRAMPGEVVVPTRMVRAGAVDHLRGQLPGFASGGRVSGPLTAPFVSGMYSAFQNQMAGSMVGAMRTSLKAAEAAAVAAAKAAAAAGSSVPGGGGGAARWSSQILTALAMLNQPGSLLGAVEHRMNQESGGNPFAVNRTDSNWARGTPSVGVMQVIGPTYRSYSAPGWRNLAPMAYGTSEDVLANTYAGLHYAVNAYRGRSLASVMMQPGGYARGGLVPGYASGGTVAAQGQTYLNAWRSRRGGHYALAVGPRTLNQQIPAMAAAYGRARTLAGAGGLSPGQHRFWANTAAGEGKLLATLRKELATERSWRYHLQLDTLALDREIRTAGNLPGLAGPVRGWKRQLAARKHTIGEITGMIGPGAAAKPKPKPPGVPGSIPHTGAYTDRTADLIAQLFAASAALTRTVTLDSGGTLAPGWNAAYNGTGRPEQLVPAGRGGGGGTIVLQNHGVIGSQAQLEDWLVRSLDNLRRKRRL